MSNSKIAVEKIKGLMKEFGFLSEEKEYQSFGILDENKTIIQVSKLEVGNTIMKINEEFNQVTLEDGSFKLKENFEISVENGVITSVRELFIDAKLVDGTEIKVEGDSLVQGAKVMVKTAEGEIPAPDGTHELSDGTKVRTVGGVIEQIDEVAEAMNPKEGDTANNQEMEDEQVIADEEKDEEEVDEENEEDTAKNIEVELYEMLRKMLKRMEEKMGNIESKVKSMESEFNAFKKEPAAKPIKSGKTDFSAIEERMNSEELKIKAIMALKNK
jgi:preprotein translocase subunit YajC